MALLPVLRGPQGIPSRLAVRQGLKGLSGEGKSAIGLGNDARHNVNTATTLQGTRHAQRPALIRASDQHGTNRVCNAVAHARPGIDMRPDHEHSRKSPPAFCAAGRLAPPMIVRLLRIVAGAGGRGKRGYRTEDMKRGDACVVKDGVGVECCMAEETATSPDRGPSDGKLAPLVCACVAGGNSS